MQGPLLVESAPSIRIVLNDAQRTLLAPLLDIAREQNGYEGLLCTVARHYSTEHGGRGEGACVIPFSLSGDALKR